MKKRWISLFLALTMVVALIPQMATGVRAVQSGTCGDNLTWVLDDTLTLTISGTGKMDNYSAVDSNQDGVYDASNAPWFGMSFTKLVVEEGATCVTMYSFAYNDTLESVILPDSLKTVNGYSFYQCTALQSIIIPNYATYIGRNAFAHCASLRSAQVSANINEIDEGAFENCCSLQTISFLYNCPEIANNAFTGVTAEAFYPSEEDLWAPDTLTGYGGDITWSTYTPPLAIVEQPEDTKESLHDWVAFNIKVNRDDAHFHWQYSKDGAQWDTVTDADYWRQNLTIRATKENQHWQFRCLVYIFEGEEVFSRACKFTLEPSTGRCGNTVSWSLDMDASALILSGYGDTWDYDTSSVTSWDGLYSEITYVQMSSGITSIGDRLFDECYKMKYIMIPDTVTRIGDSAFNLCYLLKDIYYSGTKEQWEAIHIGADNYHLKDVNVYFESTGPGTGYLGVEAASRIYPILQLDDNVFETPNFPFDSDEWECLIYSNKARYQENIGPLTSFPLLHKAAAVREEEIITVFDHKRPDGSSCFSVLDDFGISRESAGENLIAAVGSGKSAVEGWLSSPPHRENLLSYSHIGIGYNGYSWVQLFTWHYGDLYLPGEFTLPNELHIPAGASLDELNLYTIVSTYQHDTCYLPISSEHFRNYNPNKVGKQTVTASFLIYSVPLDIYVDFADISKDDFYYTPVLWAAENGITSGISDTRFAPNDVCLRSQVVTFLWRAAGCPTVDADNPFVDVKPTDYYYDAVLWAVDQGITNGLDDTHFGPNDTCNRSQVVTFLWRAAGCPVVEADNPFTDVKPSDYYYDAILWAAKKGVTTGITPSTFVPFQTCNRSQVVTFLYRADNIPEAETYTFELRSNDPSEQIG